MLGRVGHGVWNVQCRGEESPSALCRLLLLDGWGEKRKVCIISYKDCKLWLNSWSQRGTDTYFLWSEVCFSPGSLFSSAWSCQKLWLRWRRVCQTWLQRIWGGREETHYHWCSANSALRTHTWACLKPIKLEGKVTRAWEATNSYLGRKGGFVRGNRVWNLNKTCRC